MIHMIFIPQKLGLTTTSHHHPAASKHNSRHLLRCDLRSICRHRTGDLKMKGVVGPRGAGLELERRLPRSVADGSHGEPKGPRADAVQGWILVVDITPVLLDGYGIPTCPLFIRLQPCLIK